MIRDVQGSSYCVCVCMQLSGIFFCSQIVLAVVACGDRLSETLVMIKSAILFTQKPLNFIVLADDPLIPSFKEKV